METYRVIDDSPIALDFDKQDKKALGLYAEWFFQNKERRIAELSASLNSDVRWSQWKPDYSEASFVGLAQWLRAHVEKEIADGIYTAHCLLDLYKMWEVWI